MLNARLWVWAIRKEKWRGGKDTGKEGVGGWRKEKVGQKEQGIGGRERESKGGTRRLKGRRAKE